MNNPQVNKVKIKPILQKIVTVQAHGCVKERYFKPTGRQTPLKTRRKLNQNKLNFYILSH